MPIKQLLLSIEIVEEFTERTKDLDDTVFLPIIAMILEERSKATGYDVTELGRVLYESIISVNEEEGKYE